VDKINTLSRPEQAILGGGILMLISSFFDWWHYSVAGFGSVGESGWGKPAEIWSILAILLSIVLAGIIGATKFGNMQMPALPEGVTWGKVWGGGAAAVVILMILKAWRITAVDVGGFGIGFFIGVVAAAAIAYGGYMLYTEEKARGG
jgi:hypothetical protein